MKTKRVYIVARHYEQARTWSESVGHRIIQNDFRYVNDVWKLQGVQDIIIVLLNGWSQHPEGKKLAILIDLLERLGRAEVILEQNFQTKSQNSEDISRQRQETPESQ